MNSESLERALTASLTLMLGLATLGQEDNDLLGLTGAVEVSDWHGPPVSSRIVFIGRELKGVPLEEALRKLHV